MIRTLVLFGLVATFVLLIACFNFINLTTARSGNRALEVGIRKVIGAQRKDLVKQFFGETVLTSLVALVLALGLAAFGLPFYSRLAERELTLGSALNGTALVGLVVIAIVTGLIAGGYPAVFLSSFRPASIIRGQLSKGSKGGTFRKILIMVQFSISILLIITTLGVTRQLRFIRNMDLGLDRDNLLFVQMRGDMVNKYESMKNELLQHPGVKRVSRSVQNPAFIGSTVSKLDWDGKNPQERVSINWGSMWITTISRPWAWNWPPDGGFQRSSAPIPRRPSSSMKGPWKSWALQVGYNEDFVVRSARPKGNRC